MKDLIKQKIWHARDNIDHGIRWELLSSFTRYNKDMLPESYEEASSFLGQKAQKETLSGFYKQ